jgi:uncharacterized membrane protein
MVNYRSRLVTIGLALSITGYVIFFTTQLCLHYYSFGSRALDLGNMGQAIWNTSQGRLFHQTNQPGLTNRLSLHVEPILIPISLLYHVYSGPETLFIVQTVVVGLGAIPVFALARLKLKNDGLALIFGLVYLMFPAIEAANLLDFHAVTLAPAFFLAAFYYLETRRLKRFALWAVLTAACKEDMTLPVLMLGLYAFFINRQRWVGGATVVFSGLWLSLAVFVIPPLFAGTGNIHWNRYDHLGDGALNIVMNVFLQPHLFLDHLYSVNAANYVRLLLTPTGFMALFNPITLLFALPSLGINLLSNFPPMQRANSLIYAAPIVPAILISSIYGLANLKGFVGQVSGVRCHGPTLSFLFNITLGSLILFATITYHYQFGYLPGGGQYRGWEVVTGHHRRVEAILAQIPDEAALSAQDRLNPHASGRETLYIFDRIDDADHIVLDVTEDSWPLHPVELRHRVDQFLNDQGFGIVDATDGYLLLAKNDPTGGQPDFPTTLPDRFFDFARVDEPTTFQAEVPVSITFDDKLELVGFELRLGAHEEFLPVLTLYWRALQPLEANYSLWPFFIDRNGHLIEDPSQRPLVTTLWYPTSRWSPDEIIQTRTLPRDLGDEFTLAVGVAAGSWANPAERLQITRADEDIYLFENQTWARLGAFQRTGRKSYEAITIPAGSKRATSSFGTRSTWPGSTYQRRHSSRVMISL